MHYYSMRANEEYPDNKLQLGEISRGHLSDISVNLKDCNNSNDPSTLILYSISANFISELTLLFIQDKIDLLTYVQNIQVKYCFLFYMIRNNLS